MSAPTEDHEVEGASLSKETGCDPPDPFPSASGDVEVDDEGEDEDPPPHPATTATTNAHTATNEAIRNLTAPIQIPPAPAAPDPGAPFDFGRRSPIRLRLRNIWKQLHYVQGIAAALPRQARAATL